MLCYTINSHYVPFSVGLLVLSTFLSFEIVPLFNLVLKPYRFLKYEKYKHPIVFTKDSKFALKGINILCTMFINHSIDNISRGNFNNPFKLINFEYSKLASSSAL